MSNEVGLSFQTLKRVLVNKDITDKGDIVKYWIGIIEEAYKAPKNDDDFNKSKSEEGFRALYCLKYCYQRAVPPNENNLKFFKDEWFEDRPDRVILSTHRSFIERFNRFYHPPVDIVRQMLKTWITHNHIKLTQYQRFGLSDIGVVIKVDNDRFFEFIDDGENTSLLLEVLPIDGEKNARMWMSTITLESDADDQTATHDTTGDDCSRSATNTDDDTSFIVNADDQTATNAGNENNRRKRIVVDSDSDADDCSRSATNTDDDTSFIVNDSKPSKKAKLANEPSSELSERMKVVLESKECNKKAMAALRDYLFNNRKEQRCLHSKWLSNLYRQSWLNSLKLLYPNPNVGAYLEELFRISVKSSKTETNQARLEMLGSLRKKVVDLDIPFLVRVENTDDSQIVKLCQKDKQKIKDKCKNEFKKFKEQIDPEVNVGANVGNRKSKVKGNGSSNGSNGDSNDTNVAKSTSPSSDGSNDINIEKTASLSSQVDGNMIGGNGSSNGSNGDSNDTNVAKSTSTSSGGEMNAKSTSSSDGSNHTNIEMTAKSPDIEHVMKERDQALERAKQAEEMLKQAEEMLKKVTKERDDALRSLGLVWNADS